MDASKQPGSTRGQVVTRLRRALTALAYASLVLDIFIAVITSSDSLGIADIHGLLIPVNIGLTIIVILSGSVFGILLVEKVIPSKESAKAT